jgi:hypothetical protein
MAAIVLKGVQKSYTRDVRVIHRPAELAVELRQRQVSGCRQKGLGCSGSCIALKVVELESEVGSLGLATSEKTQPECIFVCLRCLRERCRRGGVAVSRLGAVSQKGRPGRNEMRACKEIAFK